ncbi:MAG: sugar transferase [Lachnospiraceae bacterium]
MKNYEQYKRLLRSLFSLALIAVEMGMYWYVWLTYYNGKMEVPYNRTGNWLMVAVYGVLLIVFSGIYGGFKIGYLRIFNIIFSQALVSLCANVLIYLQITLVTKHFQALIPLLVMMGCEVVFTTIWSAICNLMYLKIYPPRKVILIYGEHPVYSLMVKLYSRADRYEIGELLHISVGMDVIKEKVKLYQGVIICDIPSGIRNRILKYCYGESIRTYTIPKISDILIRSAENLHLFDTPLMLSRNNGLNIEQQFAKRVMDLVISIIALVILSPVFLLVAIAVKLYDGGPVFYRQDRCTKDGKIFSIYKFRSMIVDAERKGQSIPAADGDPRITPVGNFIRKTRIDELPQLFNIIAGDMSLVGPRPERVEHVEIYTREIPEFVYRMKVKGGLTGYAQVYGKYNTTAYDKLKLDLMYIQTYSIWMDIEIIFKTIKILFLKESTEGFSSEQSEAVTREEFMKKEFTNDQIKE